MSSSARARVNRRDLADDDVEWHLEILFELLDAFPVNKRRRSGDRRDTLANLLRDGIGAFLRGEQKNQTLLQTGVA